MKRYLLLLLFASLINLNCTNDSVSSSPESLNYGNVSIILDKASVPVDVAQITATLSRENSKDITAILSFQSDSTAELNMTQIPAGFWHLDVKAFNANKVLVYYGYTDVAVYEDNTTNISLTLEEVYNKLAVQKISFLKIGNQN